VTALAPSQLILPRLYADGWPLLRLFGIACVTCSFGTLTSMARQAVLPIPPGESANVLLQGALAFLVAGFLAAAVAYSVWELQGVPCVRNLPGLFRRARREVSVLGFVAFGATFGIGGALHGLLSPESAFLSVAALLGFTVGIVSTLDPRRWNEWLGGVPVMLLVFGTLFFLPEIARLTAHGGLLWTIPAGVAMLVSIDRSIRGLERGGKSHRYTLADSNTDRVSEFNHATGGTIRLRRAPRGGADRFQGLRQTNLDWVRAMLHESYGMLRGGLVAFAVRIAIATVIVTGMFLISFRALGNLRAIDATTGKPATSETIHFSTEHQGLSGFSADWFTLPFEGWTLLPTASSIMMAIFTALAWNLVGKSSSLPLPISRRRFATVRWLRMQLEDVALVGGMLAGLLAMGAILSSISEHNPWTNLRAFVSLTIAAFVLLPFIYWMRLWWVDARVGSPMGLGMGSRTRAPRLDAGADSADPWTLLGYAIATVATVGGGNLVMVWWTELSMYLRAVLPTTLDAWIPLVILVPIALVRWLWLVELRRYYRSSELA
jgi:hypothetical protein